MATRTGGPIVWIVAAAIAATASTAFAQQPAPLTLGQAIAEALERSPELQPREDAVALATIRERIAAAAFAVKIAPELGTTSDPVGGDVKTAGVHFSKRLHRRWAFFSATRSSIQPDLDAAMPGSRRAFATTLARAGA
jgi:hypothetical protein